MSRNLERASNPYGESLKKCKRSCKAIAVDLGYPEIVQRKIEAAKSQEEVSNIMISARHGDYDKYR